MAYKRSDQEYEIENPFHFPIPGSLVRRPSTTSQPSAVSHAGSRAPQTLVLRKTNASITKPRAPGPGAIKKIDYKEIADHYLKNRHVVLHTDATRAYKLRVPVVVHDSVRHCKKKMKVGKWKWVKPVYTKLTTHRLPDGTKLKTKAGSQILDRAWQFIKDHLDGLHIIRGSGKSELAIRSAQWLYWNRNSDTWLATASMVQSLSN
eukprot:6036872-Amphidinium_carterae.1